MDYYKYMDKKLSKLKTSIRKAFARKKAVMKFDETNIIRNSKELYKELDKMNTEVYLEIGNAIYHEIYPESKKKLDKKWLLLILAGYDPVTKYVYTHEIERKKARFYEALMSTGATSKEFQKGFDLWWTQTAQYGITITDSAVVEAYKDMGIKYLKWNTEKDNKVCEKCKARDGKLYPIDNLPSKEHYHCRCYWTKGDKDERD